MVWCCRSMLWLRQHTLARRVAAPSYAEHTSGCALPGGQGRPPPPCSTLGNWRSGPKSSQSSRSPAFRSWLSAGAIWQHWRTMQGDGRSSAAIHTSNRDGCVSNVKFGKSPSEGRIIRLRHCPRFPDSRTLVHHYFRGLEPRRIPVSYFRACKVLRYSMPKAM
jgi:hypothetical protein